jgi:hypothetical protein
MMFATTAFMTAAQAQSSYPYPCANDVNKWWGGSPGVVAKAMCAFCGDCARANAELSSSGPSYNAVLRPARLSRDRHRPSRP